MAMFETLVQLFAAFAKIGFTSFGGTSMIPLIMDEMSSHGWMTDADLTNLIAIALLRARAAALGMTELAQKENSVRFSLPKPDFARVAATCGLEKYKGRLLFSAGEKPYLSLRLKKGDDVLKLTNLVLTDFAAAPQ